jgi:hypothetical protein
MKTILTKVICALVLVVMLSCAKEKSVTTTTNSFRETLDRHLTAIQTSNAEQLSPTIAESVSMISPNGDKFDSKKVFMDFHKGWFTLKNWKWEGKILKTESSDSLGYALIEYDYTQNDSLGNVQFKDKEYLVLIFKNSNEGWQLVHDQNTKIVSAKQ